MPPLGRGDVRSARDALRRPRRALPGRGRLLCAPGPRPGRHGRHGGGRVQPVGRACSDHGGAERQHVGGRCGMTSADETGRNLADGLIAFLETGTPPDGLFTPDVFCDFTMPQWRLQAQGIEEVVRLRKGGHPAPGRVPRSRFDATATGFVLEVEEQWEQDGDSWYCRELFRADVAAGAVKLAGRGGDPALLADALEAALVARWGPDDFGERLRLAARLAQTAAHLTDPEPQLSAHLWRLTTAWESLDVVAVHRQLRALDLLAEDTGDRRAAFFAASRRATPAAVTADL